MRPETKTRLIVGASVLVLCTVVGVLSSVLTRVSITRHQDSRRGYSQQQQQVAPQAALSAAVAAPLDAHQTSAIQQQQVATKAALKAEEPGAVQAGASQQHVATPTALAAAGKPGTAQASTNPSSASTQMELSPKGTSDFTQNSESIYMLLGPTSMMVTGMSGSGMALPYEGPGPCRQLRQISNVSLDMSTAATGCLGFACALKLRVTMPLKGTCADIPGPYPTIYFISGFTCQPPYYKTIVDSLASWGYAVIQYDRPLHDSYQPSSEQETLYFEQIMAWRTAANSSWREVPFSLAGQFASGPLAVVGHSMGGGLTAIQAGLHQEEVGAAIMLDPVDFTAMSLRVARHFLQDYHQSVMVLSVGVHCMDLRGCQPPQDHRPTLAEDVALVAAGGCMPIWTCCSWDDQRPGMENKMLTGIMQATDGPSGFVEFAAPGSWLAHIPQAGHASFLEPDSRIFAGQHDCPEVTEPKAIQSLTSALTVAFLEHKLKGQPDVEPLMLAWAAKKPEQQLMLKLKQAPAA